MWGWGDLGSARRIFVDKEKTRIIGAAGGAHQIKLRAGHVRMELGRSTSREEREQLQRRLSKLLGRAGVIKVGAVTETEMKDRKARIASALHAGRADNSG